MAWSLRAVAKTTAVVCTVLLCVLTPCGAVSYDDMVKLQDVLLNNGIRHKTMRPVPDTEDTLEVSVIVGINSLGSVSETDQTIETIVFINTFYNHFKMTWNTSEYNVSNIWLLNEDIYVPEVFLLNNAAGYIESLTRSFGKKENRAYIEHNGDVWSTTLTNLKTSCYMDMTYYPFDIQRCDFELASVPFPDIRLMNTSFSLPKLDADASWDFLDSKTYSVCNDSIEHKLVYSFLIKRKVAYYILTMLIPLLILSFINIVVFVLPSDSGEKMGTCLTILLTYSFYLETISDYLPDTSKDICLLNLYLTILFVICAFCVIVTAIIIKCHHTSPSNPVGSRFIALTYWVRRKLMRRKQPSRGKISSKASSGTETTAIAGNGEFVNGDGRTASGDINMRFIMRGNENNNGDHTAYDPTTELLESFDESNISWADVAEALDRLCLVIFAFLNTASTVVIALKVFVGAQNQQMELPDSHQFSCNETFFLN